MKGDQFIIYLYVLLGTWSVLYFINIRAYHKYSGICEHTRSGLILEKGANFFFRIRQSSCFVFQFFVLNIDIGFGQFCCQTLRFSFWNQGCHTLRHSMCQNPTKTVTLSVVHQNLTFCDLFDLLLFAIAMWWSLISTAGLGSYVCTGRGPFSLGISLHAPRNAANCW